MATKSVINHFGTAGPGNSYGYAETVEGEHSYRNDETTEVYGPYTDTEADRQAARLNHIHDAARERLDARD